MESLDGDTEVRRLSPIGVRSSDGHIDLINGPSDHSCCSGYACQVRISMFKILFACGMEYDIHASSTLPSKVRFHLPYQTDDCKIKINLFMARQNRIDLFQNGIYVPPTNTKIINDDGSMEYFKPDATHIPDLSETSQSGDNFMDRNTETFHFIMSGGNIVDVETASSIVLNLDVAMDVSVDEFYDTDDFPNYLAALLGVDPSMVRIVNVIREDTVRSSGLTGKIIVEIGEPAKADAVNEFEFTTLAPVTDAVTTVTDATTMVTTQEITGQQSTTQESSTQEATTQESTTQTTTTAPVFNKEDISSILVEKVLNGDLNDIMEQSNITSNGNPVVQVSPIEKDLPDWYNGNGEHVQTLYRELGCTEHEYNEGTCEALNNINLDTIETYSEQDEANNQELTGETQKIELVQPESLFIISQPNNPQLAGGMFFEKIEVGMMDTNGEVMSSVGVPSDPWRVKIVYFNSDNGNNVFLGETEASFGFSLENGGVASFNSFGVKNPDESVVLKIEMVHPTGFGVIPVQTQEINILGFSDEEACVDFEGKNPVSYTDLDVKQMWGENCNSVCVLPCSGNSELACHNENACDHELMTCGGLTGGKCTCINDLSSSLNLFEEFIQPLSMVNFTSLTCNSDHAEIRINKCAVNSHFFDLTSVFASGPEFSFKNHGNHDCYGKLDFSGNGIDYVWKIPFGSCGTENQPGASNTSQIYSNSLQAINSVFQSGMADLENLLIEFSCEFNAETIVESIDIVSDRSIQNSDKVFSVNFDNEADVEENIKHTIQQFSFVEEITNSEHLLVDVGISNLDVGTETTGQRNQVLIVDRCWLSDSSQRIVSELDVVLVQNGCSIAGSGVSYEFVEMLENGVSQNVKFSVVNVFSDLKFVHCEVDVCDANSRSCTPVC